MLWQLVCGWNDGPASGANVSELQSGPVHRHIDTCVIAQMGITCSSVCVIYNSDCHEIGWEGPLGVEGGNFLKIKTNIFLKD